MMDKPKIVIVVEEEMLKVGVDFTVTDIADEAVE